MGEVMSNQSELCTWLCFHLRLGLDDFQRWLSTTRVPSTGENLPCSLLLEFSTTKGRDCSHPKLPAGTEQRAELCWEMRSGALTARSCVCSDGVISQRSNALKIGCNEVSMQLPVCDPPEHSARRSTLNTPH